MAKRNPLTFLEESLQSIKEYLDGGGKANPLAFDSRFILELEKELKSILRLCDVLNKDTAFIQRINTLADPGNANTLLHKTEHFFLSDLITLYEELLPKADEKSGFVLAYYYDVLRNNHFADEKAVESLNQLVATPDFNKHLLKIRKENSISALQANRVRYFLTASMAANQGETQGKIVAHYKNFMNSAFGLKFKAGENPEQFFELNPAEKPVKNKNVSALVPDDSLEKVLAELNQLIGLKAVKKDVYELINLLEIQKKRTKEGLKNVDVALHTVFLGPPGTGKTSVARLLARIYKHLGFLSKGQLYETDREGLIAGYVGQTAAKVDKVVEESLGGVLFIDEAYSLTQNSMGSDYGPEAVNTLIKRMEDHRDDLAIVVAGYTEPMKQFVESNPGLRSRFNRYFYFDHFSAAELLEIFESFCKSSDFLLTPEAKEKLTDTFELLLSKKDESFGNARVARNLFEKCVQNQANRIVKLAKLTSKILKTIEESDVPEPKETQESATFLSE